MVKNEAKVADKKHICRDIACYFVVAYVAVLSFLLVDARVQLMNAQSDAIMSGTAGYTMNR